jgi:hypothetical protein
MENYKYIFSQSLIDRLGFESWANNIFVNILEDYKNNPVGGMTLESPDYNLNINWTDDEIHMHIRAYTKEGWKEHSTTHKR